MFRKIERNNWFENFYIIYPVPAILAELGEKWNKEEKTIAMKVPGCIIHISYNYMLYCRHSGYSKIKIIDHKDFKFDFRLKK